MQTRRSVAALGWGANIGAPEAWRAWVERSCVSLYCSEGLVFDPHHPLIDAPCHSDAEIAELREVIAHALQQAGGGSVRYLKDLEPAWRREEVPTQVGQMLQSLRLPMIRADTWRAMGDDKRFALLKLTRQGYARNPEAALREFGVLNGNT